MQKGAEYSYVLKSEMNKFNAGSGVLVKSMVEGSQIKMERSNRMVSENINSQEEILKRRM